MTYTVYGQTGCQPCQQVKTLLTTKGVDFQYIDIRDLVPVELDDFKEKHRSVPQVYQGDKHIGGLAALVAHLN